VLLASLVAIALAPAPAPTGITVSAAPSSSVAGGRVLVSGRALGAPQVLLWQRLARQRAFHPVMTVSTDPAGRFAIALGPRTNRAWFVTAAGRRSGTIHQSVQAAVTLEASPAGWLAGRVTPSHAGEGVLLEQLSGGTWRVFASPRLDSSSAFSLAAKVPAGTLVRAVFAGDRRNQWSPSPTLTMMLTVDPAIGPRRALPSNYFGFNWDYAGGALFSSDLPGEYSSLTDLHPGTLRWPGGTAANYFQWQQGYATDSGELNGFRFTLQDLEAGYMATGAPPLFDLNVMTSTLQSQVQMLQTAQSLGLPIRYVELGNEFYLDRPDYLKAFPTGTDYGQAAASWVTTLHQDFPGVKVAAAGANDMGDTTRAQTWNQQMLAAAQQAGGVPDAITIHVKPEWMAPVTANDIQDLFTEPYAVLGRANAVIAGLPVQAPVWVTEYNLRPDSASNPGQQVYAHALLVAELALLVQALSSSTLVNYWTSLQASLNGAYVSSAVLSSPPALTPAGLALAWVGGAAAGASYSYPIVFARGPTLGPGGPPALVGYRFSNGNDVLVNLSSQPVTLPAGIVIPSGAAYRQVTDDPTASVSYASQLPLSSGTVGGMLTLPRYSLTLVG
jgi:hypothetical protein